MAIDSAVKWVIWHRRRQEKYMIENHSLMTLLSGTIIGKNLLC